MTKSNIIDKFREKSWRIESCGTPIETARGPDNMPSDLTHKVVGEPGEAVIRESRPVESANKNVVIDRV